MFNETRDYVAVAIIFAFAFLLYFVHNLVLATVIIALICVLLMGAVLIQNPKGGGIDSTFGGSASNQMFGAAKSTDFIEKVTWYLAIALFVLCIAASLMVGGDVGATEIPLQSQ